MSVFSHPEFDNHEEVTFVSDALSGLKAIVAIHNTNRGPSLGGCRAWYYDSDDDALTDVLRLSKGMTYKASISNLALGGGKAVILKSSRTEVLSEEKILAFGHAVEKLHGRYITAEDVGTTTTYMEIIRKVTQNVVGLPRSTGFGSGNPSPVTAYGVYVGIKACISAQLGRDSLEGIKVAIEGAGSVGAELTRLLRNDNAIVYVADINPEAVRTCEKEYGAKGVELAEIYDQDVDVFSPCALGASINAKTIERLKASIVAGSANNQLKIHDDGILLKERGILYAPDYVINSGGLINVSYEGVGYSRQVALKHVEGIYDTLLEIFKLAEELNIPTSEAADKVAEKRFKDIQKHDAA